MLEKAFTAVYWIAKDEIPNVKLVSLLQLLEILGVSELKYLSQRSCPAVREMFLIIGDVLKEHYLQKIKRVDSFGLLANKTSDVSVLEQLIMFVKFVDYELGEPRTVFPSAECITDPSGSNAEVLTESILSVLEEFYLNINKMKSFVSDAASVMTGKHNGVAARLKRVNTVMLNFLCICYRLALACCDSGNETEYIKEVEGILTQIWKFLDYSPKHLNNFIKTETELHNMNLAGQTKEAVARKVRKACRTSWLSLEQSVQSVYKSYIASKNIEVC